MLVLEEDRIHLLRPHRVGVLLRLVEELRRQRFRAFAVEVLERWSSPRVARYSLARRVLHLRKAQIAAVFGVALEYVEQPISELCELALVTGSHSLGPSFPSVAHHSSEEHHAECYADHLYREEIILGVLHAFSEFLHAV